MTTAINTVSCYKSNCIRGSHGNPGDCRFVEVSSTRQSRLIKRNGVSETNLHNHCNQHGQLLQIQLHSSVARQSRRLSIRRSVEHAPRLTEIGQTNKSNCIPASHGNPGDYRQRRTRANSNEMASARPAQPLQSTRSVVTNPFAFEGRTAIQAIVARRSFLIRAHCCVLRE
jgi:hypothetical protein